MKYLPIVTVLFVACGIQKPAPQSTQSRDGFHYEVAGEPVDIVYDTRAGTQPYSVDLQVQVNSNQFDIVISAETGLQSFDGHGASLSQEERNGLASAALDYSKQQGVNEISTLEQKAIYLAFDYLSQAPDGYSFGKRAYENLSLQNEGISCIKSSSVKAQWNTRASNSVDEAILVGSNWPNNYGCMGRCGADCGWGAPSAWTKDCLDHDACSYRQNAGSGASDSNCGDEFNEAADDWLSGVVAGCNGK